MTAPEPSLASDAIDQVLARWHYSPQDQETARITSVGAGIVRLEGFSSIADEELIALPNGSYGLASDICEDYVKAILLGEDAGLEIGGVARRTRRSADIYVGEALKGRVVSPLCESLDNKPPIKTRQRFRLRRPAPSILKRGPVRTPLNTGIKAIDATIPIGRGQRELILGDRQTGKTSIAVDTILNQPDDVICVYCAIGQRRSSISRVIDTLRQNGAMARTIVVVASGDDPPGLQYLAPYAATSMAEYFMYRGRDTLIVYDDLTYHARAYRELALLLRRPPGREAYPGDIFYLHAHLLERATQLRENEGGGSLTALPIIETQAENIAAYIPTNLISITDGQIVFSRKLFERGSLPAIDIGKSVSRVGGKAQYPAFRSVSADLKLFYAQFEELEAFARFGTRLDSETKDRLERGRRVRAILQQDEQDPLQPKQQIAVLLAATSGLLDEVRLCDMEQVETSIRSGIESKENWRDLTLDKPTGTEFLAALIRDLGQIIRRNGGQNGKS
jgi:F-type H+-transporting ATPase subunit alpha